MKSRFLPLVKIKEQKIEEISAKLADIRSLIVLQKEKILALKKEFFSVKEPKEGNINYFAQKQMLNIAYKQEQNILESYLHSLTIQEDELVEILKEERMELEKFNILHKEELRKQLDMIKKKESAFMDEIGSTGFHQNRSIS